MRLPALSLALALPACALLPPASSRMMDRCQPLMAGPFPAFNDCIQRAELIRGYQDASQTNLKAVTAIAARQVAAGAWSEAKAYAEVTVAAARLSADRDAQVNENLGMAAGLMTAGAATAAPPQVIPMDPPPMRFR